MMQVNQLDLPQAEQILGGFAADFDGVQGYLGHGIVERRIKSAQLVCFVIKYADGDARDRIIKKLEQLERFRVTPSNGNGAAGEITVRFEAPGAPGDFEVCQVLLEEAQLEFAGKRFDRARVVNLKNRQPTWFDRMLNLLPG